jgi:hypothetical protein
MSTLETPPPELTAAVDQARADSNRMLDLFLPSVREHTAGMPAEYVSVILAAELSGLPGQQRSRLLYAAIHRLLDQEPDDAHA